MKSPSTDKLSRREREIMNVLFGLGNRASAEDIRGGLTDAPSYSAVRAMLVRLEAKGYLRHQEESHRYVYSATTSPAQAKRAALRQYLQTFFGGSLHQMMTALLTQETWSEEELDELRVAVDQARKERKS